MQEGPRQELFLNVIFHEPGEVGQVHQPPGQSAAFNLLDEVVVTLFYFGFPRGDNLRSHQSFGFVIVPFISFKVTANCDFLSADARTLLIKVAYFVSC
jgi:hypothetical protein